jgi:hypothetical protein
MKFESVNSNRKPYSCSETIRILVSGGVDVRVLATAAQKSVWQALSRFSRRQSVMPVLYTTPGLMRMNAQ